MCQPGHRPAHPLVGDVEVAEPLLDEMIRAHKLDLT